MKNRDDLRGGNGCSASPAKVTQPSWLSHEIDFQVAEARILCLGGFNGRLVLRKAYLKSMLVRCCFGLSPSIGDRGLFATLHNSGACVPSPSLNHCSASIQSVLNSFSRPVFSPSRSPGSLFSPSTPRNHCTDPRKWRTLPVGHANLHYEQRPSLYICGLSCPIFLHYSPLSLLLKLRRSLLVLKATTSGLLYSALIPTHSHSHHVPCTSSCPLRTSP